MIASPSIEERANATDNATEPNRMWMSRFLREPPFVRTPASGIVTATEMVVVVGGVLMRFLDHDEHSSVWVGKWWALQTVTPVGYGAVTPQHFSVGFHSAGCSEGGSAAAW